MTSKIIKEALKRVGFEYKEVILLVDDTYTFEAIVSDKVYGKIVSAKGSVYMPLESEIKYIKEEVRTSVLEKLFLFGKEDMIAGLLKRLEKLN